jgi:hypothetical protein
MELDLQHWSHALKIRLILLSLSFPCTLYFIFIFIPYKATLCGIHAAKSLMPSDRVMGSRNGLSLWFDSIMNFNMLHNQSPLLWSKAIYIVSEISANGASRSHTHTHLSLSLWIFLAISQQGGNYASSHKLKNYICLKWRLFIRKAYHNLSNGERARQSAFSIDPFKLKKMLKLNSQGDFIFRLTFPAKIVRHVAAPRHATYRFLIEAPNSDMVEQGST